MKKTKEKNKGGGLEAFGDVFSKLGEVGANAITLALHDANTDRDCFECLLDGASTRHGVLLEEFLQDRKRGVTQECYCVHSNKLKEPLNRFPICCQPSTS